MPKRSRDGEIIRKHVKYLEYVIQNSLGQCCRIGSFAQWLCVTLYNALHNNRSSRHYAEYLIA